MYREKIDEMISACRKELLHNRTEEKNTELLALQALKNEFLKAKTAKNAKPLDDASEISILRKMVTERKESSEIYTKAGRNDIADKESLEASVLEKLLPAAPSEDDINAAIEEFVATVDVFDKKQMGNCIKFVKAKIPTVDGKQLSQLVMKRLS